MQLFVNVAGKALATAAVAGAALLLQVLAQKMAAGLADGDPEGGAA